MVKGRLIYVPKEFVLELEDLKLDLGLKNNSDCLRMIAKSSRIGRELKNILGRR